MMARHRFAILAAFKTVPTDKIDSACHFADISIIPLNYAAIRAIDQRILLCIVLRALAVVYIVVPVLSKDEERGAIMLTTIRTAFFQHLQKVFVSVLSATEVAFKTTFIVLVNRCLHDVMVLFIAASLNILVIERLTSHAVPGLPIAVTDRGGGYAAELVRRHRRLGRFRGRGARVSRLSGIIGGASGVAGVCIARITGISDTGIGRVSNIITASGTSRVGHDRISRIGVLLAATRASPNADHESSHHNNGQYNPHFLLILKGIGDIIPIYESSLPK